MTFESESPSTMPAPEPTSAAHRYSKHIIVGRYHMASLFMPEYWGGH